MKKLAVFLLQIINFLMILIVTNFLRYCIIYKDIGFLTKREREELS